MRGLPRLPEPQATGRGGRVRVDWCVDVPVTPERKEPMRYSDTLEQAAHWAEIVASLAIIVSLVFLIQEVRYNNLILERQALMDRTAAFNSPFLQDSALASILARIKAVDGREPVEDALAERYDLSYEDAVRWNRHLSLLWTVLEAEYRSNGWSPILEGTARTLLSSPDNRLFWEQGAPQVTSGGFRARVSEVARPLSAETPGGGGP